ncbi:HNH endonuclease signature motif containing protein [Vibrio cholerae]|uniref:HNH endonuclease signature motif containing protein n=1 Tax=Vibrio cholerae TaxID=666 RepID=UPI002FE654A1
MRFVYSQEHIAFVANAFKKHGIQEVAALFNKKFFLNKTPTQIKALISNHGIKCGRKSGEMNAGKYRIFTKEQADFIKKGYKRWVKQEVTKQLNEKFGTQFTVAQITAFIKNNRIQSGRTGHFEKGIKPHNAGTKGLMKPNKTSFKKGNTPKNHRPVGSERVNVDGYVEIKVAEPNSWQLKQRVIYEREIGPIPEDCYVRFLDGNRQNFEPSNLIPVSNAENAFLNKRYRLNEQPIELRETLVIMAKLDVKEKKLEATTNEPTI